MTKYENEKARVNAWNNRREEFLKEQAKKAKKVKLTKVDVKEVNQVYIQSSK